VAQRCIYGVDKNPQAVTLAKLSLWLVTLARDKPFTFVDHALRRGDSLVGLDLDQITSFHWEPGAQIDVIERELRQVLEEAVAARQRIVDLAGADSPADHREKERLLEDANDAVDRLRTVGDLVLGAFFSSTKPKEREVERLRRRDLVEGWLRGDRELPGELAELALEFRARLRAFHWMIELPEVFWVKRKDPLAGGRVDGVAWIDAFVGNPPFLGGSSISGALGDAYLAWLQRIHPRAHGNADLCAHFFRRCAYLIGEHGTFGLLATNTLTQGATRTSGLQPIVAEGGVIYDAIRSMPWPGDAAVAVSLVHIAKGECGSRWRCRQLDGISVRAINSRLRAGAERTDAVALRANSDKSFLGSKPYGQGFILTPEERDSLVAKDPRNAERIFPYLGGEEVNSSPTQAFDRYVINFGDLPLNEASRWPDLIAIAREKVKPEREKSRDNSDGQRRRQCWWQFERMRPELYAAVAPLKQCLVTAQVTKHLCFSFQPTGRVFSQKLYVFPFNDYARFGLLQSRAHAAWTWLLSLTMKTDLSYSASDCFETFPFPPAATLVALDAPGRVLYEARASYMVDTNQGLTATYNQLKDPDVTDDARILELRRLHEDLDHAVLAAYGWSDVAVPPYCPATADERATMALFEDTVIDRLFALNADRAAEEAAAAGPKRPAPKKPRKARAAPANQRSLLDDK
jgi:hypothetical protein